MSDFIAFSKLIHAHYNEMAKKDLFVMGTDKHAVSDVYLAAFPEGTNPIYKTNTEHDCTCCKNFIRNLGNVVTLENDEIQTIWQIEGAPYPYDVVAKGMDTYIRTLPITSIFRSKENGYGNEFNLQQLEDGSVKRWNHFHGKVTGKHLTDDVGTQIGTFNSGLQVFKRGLIELNDEAIDTVIELINGNAIYRGAEHLPAITSFQRLKRDYKKAIHKDIFLWKNASSPGARFRNTVIGTLIQDLSEGIPLDKAVKSFEDKVAPTNYKRTTALVTPAMIKQAVATIKELDLENALERRFAKISDITINNVLWANKDVQKSMKGGIEDLLMGTVKAPKISENKIITIDAFMKDVLPLASSIELLVSGAHNNNFVSLTAPQHEDVNPLFKWGNNFAWSYNGDMTDSIKERVKTAGGNVTNAALRISLAWFNRDDLDIHVFEPNGQRIYFGNKGRKLDVDMNAGYGTSRTPVENVSYTPAQLMDGKYTIQVDQFCQRESSDIGCVVEIENNGTIVQLSYKRNLLRGTPIAVITVVKGSITDIKPAMHVEAGGISQEKWGIHTETLVPVSTVMFSPNYWDDNKVGNKHWFFILKDCKNPDATRGIYNEFLKSELEPHRKVFELLGNRTKCEPTDEQLSGLGFSSTKNDAVVVKVSGSKINSMYNVTF